MKEQRWYTDTAPGEVVVHNHPTLQASQSASYLWYGESYSTTRQEVLRYYRNTFHLRAAWPSNYNS